MNYLQSLVVLKSQMLFYMHSLVYLDCMELNLCYKRCNSGFGLMLCYRLNVISPQNSYGEAIALKMMVFGAGPLGGD